MKKVITLFFLCIINTVCAENLFFGEKANSLALNLGFGVDQGYIVPPPAKFVPFKLIHIQYSQPSSFFRFKAKQSINIFQTVGYGKKYGWNWSKFTIPAFLFSEGFILFNTTKHYIGSEIAVGLQALQNDRIGTKLLFGLKVFYGYKINNDFNFEIFVQHYSNANTDKKNYSYGFYGAGLVYKF